MRRYLVSTLLALVAVAAAFAAWSGPALADRSALAGTVLDAFAPSNVHFTGTCDPSGTSTITFSAAGSARNVSDGSTTGSFTITGSVTIGPQNLTLSFPNMTNFNGGPVGVVEGYTESFTIHVAGGTTITGTNQLDNTIHPTDTFTGLPQGWFSWGQCVDRTTSYGTQALAFDVSSVYNATIRTAGGSTSSDSGVSFSNIFPGYSGAGIVVSVSFGQYLGSGYSGPLDTTAPVAAPVQTPPAGPSGWSTGDVTVNWNWTDSGGSGIDSTRCTQSSTSSGSGVIQLSATCRDLAGNLGTASYTVQVVQTSLTMGPQAMEGNLVVSPGDTLLAGYDFTMPGAHPDATENFVNTSVTFEAQCVDGTGGGTITVPIADGSYSDLAGSSAWYPSGSAYQGSILVPDLCSGGAITLKKGGVFTTGVWSTDTSDKVSVRWHYSADGSAGGWSGTASVKPS